MSSQKTLVAVVMGSSSDTEVMQGCVATLSELEIPHEVKILSAHRTPDMTSASPITIPQLVIPSMVPSP